MLKFNDGLRAALMMSAAGAALDPAASAGGGGAKPAVVKQPDPAAKPAADTGKTAVVDPKAAPDAGKTLLDDAGAGVDDKAAVVATWPDDWRDQMGGGDDKAMAALKRYNSPQAVANALLAAQQKIKSGEYKKGLGAKATPEEIAEFRKEYGIPDKPDGYEMPKGIEVGEVDKPIVDSILAKAHAKNWTPDQAKEAVSLYFDAKEQEATQAAEADAQYLEQGIDNLRAKYGNEYRGNINGLKNWMSTEWPKGMMEAVLGGRGADGRVLGANPEFMDFLVTLMKEISPQASLGLPGAEEGGKALLDRKTEIESKMGTKEYLALAPEYQKIIVALEKQPKRAA